MTPVTNGFRRAGTTREEHGLKAYEEILKLQGPSPDPSITNLQHALNYATRKMGCRIHLDQWITGDPDMVRIKEQIPRLSVRQEPVTITGQSGSGKEILARALHGDREGKFVAVNCGGLSKELVPSLFFGHKKGSFTGAVDDRRGLLAQANNGTIFLDEIAELPLDVQAVLLRAIQENEVYPVGEVDPVAINCRFVAATKEPLEELVEQKKFREDLYGRLFTFRIHITPFSIRPHDIRLILERQPGWSTLVEQHGADSEELNIDTNTRFQEDVKRMGVRAIQKFMANLLVLGHYQ